MSSLLDGRLSRLEKKSAHKLTPWIQIVLAGEKPTLEEQQRIDDAGAKGFNVITICPIRTQRNKK